MQIQIELDDSTPQGELHAVYDPEIRRVNVVAISEDSAPYGINLNNEIIVDLSSQKVVNSIELMVDPKAWKKVTLSIPNPTFQFNLLVKERFPGLGSVFVESETISYSVDKMKGLFMVKFSDDLEYDLIQISKSFFALIHGKYWLGFVSKLPEDYV